MTRQNKPDGPRPGSREARLAEALRQNLKRRKAAGRQRAAQGSGEGTYDDAAGEAAMPQAETNASSEA